MRRMPLGELQRADQNGDGRTGCEKCHGPGSEHVAHATSKNIVNPETLDYVRGNDVHAMPHTQGRPLTNPVNGRWYDWPVGYLPGTGWPTTGN